MALMRPNVWIEISGLPPKKLPEYYRNYDFERVARKMIFGTDWPGVPSNSANALAVRDLGLPRDIVEAIFYRNALQVYHLDAAALTIDD
jgi:predicted TIM-barrel fold metal-dependent hydrolase